MIGIFDDAGNRLSITYNGLTLNNPADAEDNTYEVNSVTVTGVYDAITDPREQRDGTEAYGAFKENLSIVIDGVIRAPTIAGLFDKTKALRAAFDASKISHENSTGSSPTLGFKPLNFSTPTADTTNYATGFVSSMYYVREKSLYVPIVSQFTGTSSLFRLDLMAVDPRRYLQTQQSKVGTGTVDNSLADYRSYPRITIVMSGAGSATHTITRTGTGIAATTKALVVNLSGRADLESIVIDMEKQTIEVDGVSTPSLYVSGTWFEIEPTSQTVTYTNNTNITTETLYWYRAFCA